MRWLDSWLDELSWVLSKPSAGCSAPLQVADEVVGCQCGALAGTVKLRGEDGAVVEAMVGCAALSDRPCRSHGGWLTADGAGVLLSKPSVWLYRDEVGIEASHGAGSRLLVEASGGLSLRLLSWLGHMSGWSRLVVEAMEAGEAMLAEFVEAIRRTCRSVGSLWSKPSAGWASHRVFCSFCRSHRLAETNPRGSVGTAGWRQPCRHRVVEANFGWLGAAPGTPDMALILLPADQCAAGTGRGQAVPAVSKT